MSLCLRGGRKFYSEFEKLGKSVAKVLEEDVLLFCVQLYILFEFWVFDESKVGREHHELSS